ncbi:uncharacterized protein EDB93DRAFT_286478 [Suillus bovinus]|uniref:uncharacterized protein n=1 Tax=Suillus bovinus TaxID=48563 RepID=UPI001B8601C9|nr:uncharacterized protein EDB93DRAFT_286478 [Suillus bovinus]KAG2159404.1 hypothetical protein EDB93DRAFT_286478 [Suillus bovinus]
MVVVSCLLARKNKPTVNTMCSHTSLSHVTLNYLSRLWRYSQHPLQRCLAVLCTISTIPIIDGTRWNEGMKKCLRMYPPIRKKMTPPRDLTFNGLNGSTLRTQIHPNPHATSPGDLLQNNRIQQTVSFTKTTNTNLLVVSVAIAKMMVRIVTIWYGRRPSQGVATLSNILHICKSIPTRACFFVFQRAPSHCLLSNSPPYTYRSI